MDVARLKSEITSDPAGLGYSGKTDQQVADLMNAVTREVDRGLVAAHVLFRRFNQAEYVAKITDLTDGVRNRHLLEVLLGMGEVDINDANVEALLTTVFNGGGSATIRNLIGHAAGAFPGDDLRKKKVSRAGQLGFGTVLPGHVTEARSA